MAGSSSIVRAISAILRHPLSMAVKARGRDLKAALLTKPPVNPPVPEQVSTIVFVCLGNICRSPFAGALAARRLADRGAAGITSLSAGIRTTQAKRSPPHACMAAASYGISLDTHVPLQLTPDLVERAEMVIVMELAQFHSLRASYPRRRDRIFLLSLWDSEAAGPHARYNIDDPFGQPLETFQACYVRIERAIERLVPVLRPHA